MHLNVVQNKYKFIYIIYILISKCVYINIYNKYNYYINLKILIFIKFLLFIFYIILFLFNFSYKIKKNKIYLKKFILYFK